MDEKELDIKNEELSSVENTEKQCKNKVEYLKPYQWKKGQSGNPAGRKPGKSLKEFARQYLESLSEEDKIEFIKHIPMDTIWKMAEGNPKQDTDITSAGKPIPILTLNSKDVHSNDSNTKDTEPN